MNADLDEWLYFAAFLDESRTHALGNFPWVALNACNNGMRVWSLLGTFIMLFDDDDLLACLAAVQNDSDLSQYQFKF